MCGNDPSSAQWWFLVGLLWVIGDVLYYRTSGGGSQTWTTNGHPPNGDCDSVHISHAVISSCTIWLELTLAIPGAASSSMGAMPTGSSRSASTRSGVHKQAVTPEKPCGGVGGHISTKACASREGWGEVGTFGGETGGLAGIIWEIWLNPTFSLGVLVSWGISPVATTGWYGCNTFSHPVNFGTFLSGTGLDVQCASGTSAVLGVWGPPSSSSLGRTTPQKTSSSVNERYHSTSFLNSRMLLANRHGSPLAGRLFCSTQCWRGLAYAIIFSLGTSLISLLAKMEMVGGINLFLWRHGSAGGAWKVASLHPNSCIPPWKPKGFSHLPG